MLKWLKRKKSKPSPYSYEYIEGATTADDSDDDVLPDKPFGSTYSPYSSNARYVPIKDKEVSWCFRPSECCISCLCCFKNKEKLWKSPLMIRWRLATIISFILLLIIGAILCIFFLVAAPKMVQAIVDDCEFEFKHLTLTDPIYTERESSFGLKATAELATSFPLISFPGEIDSTVFELFYGGSLLGHFTLPKTRISVGEKSTIDINTVVTIDDMTAFDNFGKDTLNEDEVTVKLSASPDLTALSLTFSDVSMDKEVTFAAAGGLKDVEIQSFDLSRSNKTHINAAMLARIRNPSLIAIEPIGRLDFVIFYENSSVGAMLSDNINLVRGDNYVRMFGALQPADLRICDRMISLYLAGENTTVTAAAKPGEESSIPLWARILRDFSLQSELEGNTTNLIKELAIDALEIQPVDNAIATMAQTLSITVNNPLGDSPIDLKQVLLRADLLYDVPLEHEERISKRAKLVETDTQKYLVLGTLLMLEPLNITNGDQPVVTLDYSVDLELFEGGANFGVFVEDFVHLPELNITLNGTIDSNVSTVLGFNMLTNLVLNTTTTIHGLDNLPDVKILSFDLPRNSPLGGVEILLNASLHNPTVASMFLGNVTFQVLYSEFPMGLSRATNLSLFPGTIMASMQGNILPPPNAIEAAGWLFSDYITGVDSIVGVQGYDIDTDILWMKDMVRNINTTTILEGWTGELIVGVDLISLGIDFETDGLPLVNTSLVVDFELPFDFPLEIFQFAAVLQLVFESWHFATVEVPFSPARSDQTAGKLYVSFSNLELVVSNSSVFSEFINDLLLHPNSTVTIDGLSTATAHTAMGNITLTDIDFEQNVDVIGIDGFSNPPVEVVESDVTFGRPGFLTLALVLHIFNPSPASLSTGPLAVELYYLNNSMVVGNGTIADLTLQQGDNYINASGYFVQTDTNYDATYAFLSDFAQGKAMSMQIRGIPDSVRHPVLRQGVANLRSPAVIPEANRSLISYAKLEFNLLAFFQGWIPVKLTVFNPYNVRLELDTANVGVWNNDVLIGVLNATGLNITVEAKETTVTEPLHVNIEQFTLAEFWALFTVIKLDVNGTLEVVIGEGFESGMFYAQHRVPGSFLGGPSSFSSTDDLVQEEEDGGSYHAESSSSPVRRSTKGSTSWDGLGSLPW